MRQPYDRSSKWLIDTHGDAILTLAGLGPISTFRAVASELVQPRQLPDGLLAFRKPGLEEEGLALVEIATYAKSDVPEQVFDDLLLTFAVRRVVPEVVVLVLAERGPLRVAGAWEGASPLQTATLGGRWRVVQLWNLPAGPLLDRDDPGLVPWALLADPGESPEEVLLRRGRDVIARKAAEPERGNLFAVCQILGRLRYDDPKLLHRLFAEEVGMIESPFLDELREAGAVKARGEDVLRVLRFRFGEVRPEVEAFVRGVTDLPRLDQLLKAALRCASPDEFPTR